MGPGQRLREGQRLPTKPWGGPQGTGKSGSHGGGRVSTPPRGDERSGGPAGRQGRHEAAPAPGWLATWSRRAAFCCSGRATSPSRPPCAKPGGHTSWLRATRAKRRCPGGAEPRRASGGCGREVRRRGGARPAGREGGSGDPPGTEGKTASLTLGRSLWRSERRSRAACLP